MADLLALADNGGAGPWRAVADQRGAVRRCPTVLSVHGATAGARHGRAGRGGAHRRAVTAIRAALPGAAVRNIYGPTEATVYATAWRVPDIDDGQVPPIGRPVTDMRALILDEALRPVPAGVTGELYLAGRSWRAAT